MDEAVFTTRTTMKRVWRSKGSKFEISDFRKGFKPVAVIAGINLEKGVVGYVIREKSIRGEEVILMMD